MLPWEPGLPRIKFTAATVEKLKPPSQGQIDYFDAAFPALALRVTARGVRAWVYFGRVHGKIKRATLGRYPDLGLMQARRKAGQTADAMRQGVDPAAAKRAARNAVRDGFATVADEWLNRDQRKNRSHDEVKRVIDRDVKPFWNGRLITSITRRDVIELIDAIADRGAVTYARRVHAHLHRLFRWCVGRGIIEINPMADLPKPGTATKRDRTLKDSELALVWTAASDVGWPFGPAIQLLILTAARRDEVQALRWSEIFDDRIELAGSRTKNGQPHTVPLSIPAVILIASLPRVDKSEFVFTTTGKTPVSGWSKAKKRLDECIAKNNGGRKLQAWRIHDLRRTAATGLQRLGISVQVIEAILGHLSGSRAGVVGIYQRHSFNDEKRAALNGWARHVSLVTGSKAKI